MKYSSEIRTQMAKWGAKGGKKSKRVLTTEQAREMVKAREAKRPCTCHADDDPPKPCAEKYSLSECKKAGSI
jgi:hypothetical protein